MMAILTVSACTGGSERPLPAACDLVTPADVGRAIGLAVRSDGAAGNPERCRYLGDGKDEVEITVDRPGFDGAVEAYRGLKPGAEQVEGIGEDGALLSSDGVGELIFVKGRTRFFVVVASPSSSREALLILGRTAADRM